MKASRSLDKWSGKGQTRSESVRKGDTFSVNDGNGIRSAKDKDQGDRLHKKAQVQYKSDNVYGGPHIWVPYVHLGVMRLLLLFLLSLSLRIVD